MNFKTLKMNISKSEKKFLSLGQVRIRWSLAFGRGGDGYEIKEAGFVLFFTLVTQMAPFLKTVTS